MKYGVPEKLLKEGYSKVSIIRPLKKKDSTGRLIDTFSKYPDQVF